jgi:hypothetical protein
MRARIGQGATEYLVLLAVVLIVALVSVALLGFFPGMASDSQRQQSEIYWRSASPIAITEWAAKAYSTNGYTYPYFRVRNTGAYPIRIIGVVGSDGNKATTFYGSGCGIVSGGTYNISDYYYLAPGEEKYFIDNMYAGVTCNREISVRASQSTGNVVGNASSLCAVSNSTPETLIIPSLGFEYAAYIDGQQVTKRQIGKQVIIKCLPPY